MVREYFRVRFLFEAPSVGEVYIVFFLSCDHCRIRSCYTWGNKQKQTIKRMLLSVS